MVERVGSLLQRDLHQSYPMVVRGEGVYLYDADGKRYLDGSGGAAAVTAIGHGVPSVIDAMADQARKISFSPSHAFTNEPAEACARYIIEEFAPAGFSHVWFVSGGSEATDNAVKMAVQYHRERGQGTRQIVIGRWMSFHGATLAALAYGGNVGRRRPYAGMLPHAEHIPPCHPYRFCPDGDEVAYGLEQADALEQTILQVGAENVAAFIAEPVVGATLGAVPATVGYFARIREICDRHGVVFIADEVMTGFGRTGKRFGMDHWRVLPDLITCAKGISGGYTPLGAVLARPEFVHEISSRGNSFVIGHTSSSNPLSCATGLAVLRYVKENGLVENAASVGQYFLDNLAQLQSRHEMIGDTRGSGLLCGIEFVQNRVTRQPFPVTERVSKRISAATLARGLVSYPGTGTADGVSGDHMLYAPPLTISRDQIDELIDILDVSLVEISDQLAVVA